MKISTVAVTLLGTTLLAASAQARHPKPRPPQEFEIATIKVETNATDDDTEVVIIAKGGDDGFRRFSVRSPDGRDVVSVFSLDRSVMGQRELLFESPEPPGEAILAAYPEGKYRFKGQTHEGVRFEGSARLSHQMPAPTVILWPADESTVSTQALTIQWSAVPGVSQYLLELENESADPEQALSFNLPPGATSFEVPASLLSAGAGYQLSLGTVAANGNIVFVESGFATE